MSRTNDPSPKDQRISAYSTFLVIGLLGGGVIVALAATVIFFVLRSEDAPEQLPKLASSPMVVVPEPSNPPAEADPVEVAVEDDGQLLWVSPTAGPPISLRYVPLGTQLLLHLRPADLLAHAEGEKIRAALGPWGVGAIAEIEKSTGARLDEIATLLVCIHPEASGELGWTLRCEFIEPWTDQQLAERHPESSAPMHGSQPYLVASSLACFLPLDDEGKTLISCPVSIVADLIESGSDAPPLARDIERLLARSDRQRCATLVFPTKFIQTSGHNLLRGTAQNLHFALQELVGDDAAVVAWSAHWGEDFFLELQSTVAFNQQPHIFAAAARRRMSQAPDTIAEALLVEPPAAYSREVLTRLPEMLRQVGSYTRTDEEQGVSTMRCYLPLAAGHNLLMGVELALNTRRGDRGRGRLGSLPMTLAEKLRKITSLSFPKETFQQALQMLSDEIGVPILLQGSDLQLEGIGKNQSFGIDVQDRPAAEILMAVLLRANPDRSASGPADPKQKLVYVVRETSGDQPGAIVVTTRSAAARGGIKLPAVFETQ